MFIFSFLLHLFVCKQPIYAKIVANYDTRLKAIGNKVHFCLCKRYNQTFGWSLLGYDNLSGADYPHGSEERNV